MEWSITQVAKMVGTTSRTLRHYDDLGLVAPSRIGFNGYRYYDEQSLVRLQRVLLLRELGLGLPQVADILTRQGTETEALTAHLALLHQEQARLTRQIAAVTHTITALEGNGTLMATQMFDGFDHSQHRDEVEQRWGKEAYATSDAWWRGMTDAERADWQSVSQRLGEAWTAAAATPGLTPDSPDARALAARHVEWLRSIPGTPAANPEADLAAYVGSLADMYVADPRFAANYGGIEGATFVRDALRMFLG